MPPKNSTRANKKSTTDITHTSSSSSDNEAEEQQFNDAIEPSPTTGSFSSSSLSNIPPESTMVSDSDIDEDAVSTLEMYCDSLNINLEAMKDRIKELNRESNRLNAMYKANHIKIGELEKKSKDEQVAKDDRDEYEFQLNECRVEQTGLMSQLKLLLKELTDTMKSIESIKIEIQHAKLNLLESNADTTRVAAISATNMSSSSSFRSPSISSAPARDSNDKFGSAPLLGSNSTLHNASPFSTSSTVSTIAFDKVTAGNTTPLSNPSSNSLLSEDMHMSALLVEFKSRIPMIIKDNFNLSNWCSTRKDIRRFFIELRNVASVYSAGNEKLILSEIFAQVTETLPNKTTDLAHLFSLNPKSQAEIEAWCVERYQNLRLPHEAWVDYSILLNKRIRISDLESYLNSLCDCQVELNQCSMTHFNTSQLRFPTSVAFLLLKVLDPSEIPNARPYLLELQKTYKVGTELSDAERNLLANYLRQDLNLHYRNRGSSSSSSSFTYKKSSSASDTSRSSSATSSFSSYAHGTSSSSSSSTRSSASSFPSDWIMKHPYTNNSKMPSALLDAMKKEIGTAREKPLVVEFKDLVRPSNVVNKTAKESFCIFCMRHKNDLVKGCAMMSQLCPTCNKYGHTAKLCYKSESSTESKVHHIEVELNNIRISSPHPVVSSSDSLINSSLNPSSDLSDKSLQVKANSVISLPSLQDPAVSSSGSTAPLPAPVVSTLSTPIASPAPNPVAPSAPTVITPAPESVRLSSSVSSSSSSSFSSSLKKPDPYRGSGFPSKEIMKKALETVRDMDLVPISPTTAFCNHGLCRGRMCNLPFAPLGYGIKNYHRGQVIGDGYFAFDYSDSLYHHFLHKQTRYSQVRCTLHDLDYLSHSRDPFINNLNYVISREYAGCVICRDQNVTPEPTQSQAEQPHQAERQVSRSRSRSSHRDKRSHHSSSSSRRRRSRSPDESNRSKLRRKDAPRSRSSSRSSHYHKSRSESKSYSRRSRSKSHHRDNKSRSRSNSRSRSRSTSRSSHHSSSSQLSDNDKSHAPSRSNSPAKEASSSAPAAMNEQVEEKQDSVMRSGDEFDTNYNNLQQPSNF